ncbi:MAG: hypothetical protein QOF78_567 [Phycisphaerales bacterium]|nr:hypothetical protein [Phycisphaerales bacterium]
MGKLVAAAAVGLAGFGASQANASLIVDVRATAVNGVPLSAASAKEVTASPGDVVTLALFAQVSGTNGTNDDSVTSSHGNIVSGAGPSTVRLLGSLSGGVVPPFNGVSYQNGSNVDLDADGDLDIGAPLGSGGTAALGYFLARSNATTPMSGVGGEVQIGSVNFTVTGAEGDTLVNFVRRATAANGNQSTAGIWFEDGVQKNPNVAPYGPGAPVLITVPEPTGLALAGLATLGLLARRRNKNA